jgi:hypothetical protein
MDDIMNKRPAFQFYPADWRKDPQLQMCSMVTQGIWINILCCMWEANEEGKLEGTWQDFARLLGITEQDFKRFFIAAKRHKFADVTKRDGIVTIINRRMNSVFLERERAKKGMKAHRAKQRYENVTSPSSTSSSTSTTKKEYMSIFNEARKLFGGTKRGIQTEYDYFVKTHKDWKDVLPLLVPSVKQQIIYRAKDGRYWKGFKSWIYNRCWEETVGATMSPVNEQQALERKRQEIRKEYGTYYREKTIDELTAMRGEKMHLARWWLIDEIIKKKEGK